MKTDTPVVAVLNSNEDILEVLQLVLSDEGYRTITRHVVDFKKGREDLVKFFKENDPRVVIYDVAPPYKENWNFFQLIKNSEAAQGRGFLITSTNKKAFEDEVGQSLDIELMGKPYDLAEVVGAVKKLLSQVDGLKMDKILVKTI